MEEYQQKVFRAYLDKEPQKYVPPSILGKEVPEVANLKPQLKSFHIYKYPDEHVVVLEGSGLWFCHEVHLGEMDNVIHVKNFPQLNTGRSIQFNYQPTEKSDRLIATKDKKVKYVIHSHFSNPIRKKILAEQVMCNYVTNL